MTDGVLDVMYNTLKADKNYANELPSNIDDFKKQIGDSAVSRKFYDVLSKDPNYKNELPSSFDSFYSQIKTDKAPSDTAPPISKWGITLPKRKATPERSGDVLINSTVNNFLYDDKYDNPDNRESYFKSLEANKVPAGQVEFLKQVASDVLQKKNNIISLEKDVNKKTSVPEYAKTKYFDAATGQMKSIDKFPTTDQRDNISKSSSKLGNEYLSLGQADKAESMYLNSIATNRNSTEGYNGLAYISAQSGDMDNAKKMFTQAYNASIQNKKPDLYSLESLIEIKKRTGDDKYLNYYEKQYEKQKKIQDQNEYAKSLGEFSDDIAKGKGVLALFNPIGAYITFMEGLTLSTVADSKKVVDWHKHPDMSTIESIATNGLKSAQGVAGVLFNGMQAIMPLESGAAFAVGQQLTPEKAQKALFQPISTLSEQAGLKTDSEWINSLISLGDLTTSIGMFHAFSKTINEAPQAIRDILNKSEKGERLNKEEIDSFTGYVNDHPEVNKAVENVKKTSDNIQQIIKDPEYSGLKDQQEALQEKLYSTDNPEEHKAILDDLSKINEQVNKKNAEFEQSFNKPEPISEPQKTADELHSLQSDLEHGKILPENMYETNEKVHELQDKLVQETPVKSLLNKRVNFRGENGDMYQDGQTVVFDNNKGRTFEVGNIDELQSRQAKDLGIQAEVSPVSRGGNGEIVVRGNEYVNNYSDPEAAINRDDQGNIVSVNLETKNGLKRTFRGKLAEDIAYELKQDELAKRTPEKLPATPEKQTEQAVVHFEQERQAIDNTSQQEPPVAQQQVPTEQSEIPEQSDILNQEAPITGQPNKETSSTEEIPTDDKPVESIQDGEPSKRPTVTSIKNDNVDQDRTARGLEPIVQSLKKSLGTSWDNAMKTLDDNPGAGKELIDKLDKKPFPMTDEQVAILTYEYQTLKNDANKVTDALLQAADSDNPELVLENRLRLADYNDQIDHIENLAKQAGTESARGLNARKLAITDDFSLATMLREERASTGGKPVSATREAEITALYQKLRESELKVQNYEKQIEDDKSKRVAEKQIRRINTEVNKTRRAVKLEDIKQERNAILSEFKTQLRESRKVLSANPIPLAMVPYMAKMAKTYIQEGVIKLEDIVENIYNDIKDSFDELTIRDVRDAISGYGYEDKIAQTKPELQKQVADIKTQAMLVSKLEDLLAKKPIIGNDRTLPKRSIEVEKLLDQITSITKEQKDVIRQKLENERETARLEKEFEKEKDKEARQLLVNKLKEQRELEKELSKRTPEEVKLDNIKKNLFKKSEEVKRRIDEGDFEKQPKTETVLDKEALKLRADYERLKGQYKLRLEENRLKERSGPKKAVDAILKYRRGVLLTNPITLAKLTSAAVARFAVTPIEEAIGGIYSSILPKGLVDKAYREAGFNLKAEAKAFSEGFTKGIDDARKTAAFKIKIENGKPKLDYTYGGKSDLEAVYGEKYHLPPEAIDYFGHLHSSIKAPVKRAEFERSFVKRSVAYERQGLDVSDPLIQTRIATEAYKDANRAIFMQDNMVSDFYEQTVTQLEKSIKHPTGGKATAAVLNLLFPFMKVPTNMVSERITYIAGVPIGAIKFARAFMKGFDKLTPEQADDIMRNFKKGSIGAGLMIYAWYNADSFGGLHTDNKRTPEGELKPGEIGTLNGTHIPVWILESPVYAPLQYAATMKKLVDRYNAGSKDNPYLEAGYASTLGLLEGLPLIDQQIRVVRALGSPKERDYFINELIKSSLEPALVQKIAQWTDRDENGNLIERKPSNFIESLESGVPGLREQVPKK